MKYYAVIDTNVLVSAMLNGTSIPGIVVSKVLAGPIVPLLSEEIINEYQEVLLRKKFGLDSNAVMVLVSELKKRANFLDRSETSEEFHDLDDVVFYEVVMAARENGEAYLITGNKKHFPIKPFVVTPREMLEIIGEKD